MRYALSIIDTNIFSYVSSQTLQNFIFTKPEHKVNKNIGSSFSKSLQVHRNHLMNL
jgi:hypothetical protein